MEVNVIEFAIAKLEAKSGDTVILKYDKLLTREQRAQIGEQATGALPEGVKVMVLDAGMDMVLVPGLSWGADACPQ